MQSHSASLVHLHTSVPVQPVFPMQSALVLQAPPHFFNAIGISAEAGLAVTASKIVKIPMV